MHVCGRCGGWETLALHVHTPLIQVLCQSLPSTPFPDDSSLHVSFASVPAFSSYSLCHTQKPTNSSCLIGKCLAFLQRWETSGRQHPSFACCCSTTGLGITMSYLDAGTLFPWSFHFMSLNQDLTLLGADWCPLTAEKKFPSSLGITQNSQINAKLSQVT